MHFLSNMFYEQREHLCTCLLDCELHETNLEWLVQERLKQSNMLFSKYNILDYFVSKNLNCDSSPRIVLRDLPETWFIDKRVPNYRYTIKSL